jgi:hypothetical protein
MKPNELIRAFVKIFPEFSAQSSEIIRVGHGDPGGHVLLGDVLNPYLEENLPEPKDKGLVKRIFDFLEWMALSNDEYAVGVLSATVLERLGDSPDRLQAAWQFMGDKTKLLSVETEKQLGRKPFSA